MRSVTDGEGIPDSQDDLESSLYRRRTTAFLLSDRYEEVMSKFNFPRPAEDRLEEPLRTPHGERWQSGSNLIPPSASIAPYTFGMSFDFMDGMFQWDSFSLTPKDISHIEDESITYGISLADDPKKLSRLKDGIMNAESVQRLGENQMVDLQIKLDRMLTASQMSACLACYFRGWHKNCRIVHKPSFSAGSANNCLLAAMIFLGSTYSPDREIRSLTHDVIEQVESYIFGQEIFTLEENQERIPCIRHDFEILQSGLLMVVIQFWTGNKTAKRRAATRRFTSVVQAARAMGLLSVRREPQDKSSETTWILTESQIRTITYIILLDCALLFFKGLPLRILSSEIECDLPCDESAFESEHLHIESLALFEPVYNARAAFRALFDSQITASELKRSLTILGTFILIHMLYRYVNDILTMKICRDHGSGMRSENDVLTTEAIHALDRWHQLWSELRDNAKQDGHWDELGFFKNGDQYEAATRLLLSHQAKPVIKQLLAADTDRLSLLQRLNNRVPLISET